MVGQKTDGDSDEGKRYERSGDCSEEKPDENEDEKVITFTP